MSPEPTVPNGVDPTMHNVQGPAAQPHFYRPATNAEPSELPTPHDPMLPLRKRRNGSIHQPRRIALTAAFAVYATVNAAVSDGDSIHLARLDDEDTRVARETSRI